MRFDDKYIDYKSKSKRELYENLILFKLLSKPKLVSIGKYILKICLFLKIPISVIIKNTIFKHFCGGENINESIKVIQTLSKNNIKTILDYSVEGQKNESGFQDVFNEILRNIEISKKSSEIPFCVFKLTGIARFELLEKLNNKLVLSDNESKELDSLKLKLNKICALAEKVNTPILIDAEESWIQDAIDSLAEKLMSKFNIKKVIVYNTIQLYRKGRLEYIKKIHRSAKNENFKLGLKLVRGAYIEKERMRAKKNGYNCPIHNNKDNCDVEFNNATKYCIENIKDISVCFGTHNLKSTQIAIELMKQNKIKNNDTRIYFSQLLGMCDTISYSLSKFNYNVAKYVPYGPVKSVLPYLIRRAEENSSIGNQTSEEIGRLKKAIKNY